MNRIARVGKSLQVLFALLAIILSLFWILYWIFVDYFLTLGFDQTISRVGIGTLPLQTPLPPVNRLLGFTVGLIPLGIDLAVFLFLYKLFGLYARSRIFTEANVRLIRRIGCAILIGQASSPIHQALLTLVLTFNNEPGQRVIRIGFSSTDLSKIVTALIIIVVAWVMDEGRKLREENALVI